MDQSVRAARLADLSITTCNSHKITMQDAEVRLRPGLRSVCPGQRRTFTDGIANVSFLRQTHINHANDWLYKCTRVWLWIKLLVFAVVPAPIHARHSALDDTPVGQLDIHCRHILRVSKHLLELSMAAGQVTTAELGGYLCRSLHITTIFGKKKKKKKKGFMDLDGGKGRLYQQQHRETH